MPDPVLGEVGFRPRKTDPIGTGSVSSKSS
jgi:hypothetical protein